MARKEPQNLDAEINALGCAFLNKEALDKVCEELTSSMFYDEKNAKIFEVLSSLRNKEIAVDITTVTNELEKSGNGLSTVGGYSYLTEVIDSVATPANINYYINIIFEKFILRTLINKSSNIIEECYDESEDLNSIVENAEKSILEVNSGRMVKEIKPIQEVLVKAQQELEFLAKNGGDVTGVPTGFYDLDKRTTGFHGNELIIIAGRPGMGKSALAINMATNMAVNYKKSVALFNLEMGSTQIVNRMLSSVGQINSQKLRTGKLDHTDWKKYNETLSLLADTKFYIDDTPGITVSEIRSKCRRLKNSDKGLDCIIIDYLQLISSSNKYSGQRTNEVSEISRDLKKLAMELEVPVIALAQLSRGVEQREDKRPLMSDLKESGSIEQDADIVMFLYCDDYYKFKSKDRPQLSPTELIISKHRSGGTGTIDLIFERTYTNFKNVIKSEENENE
ncbi:replicative DNA helicase [Clostridium sp. CAG:628]|nr:replicative DNA helicase [Clostridium sp. CAG:628]